LYIGDKDKGDKWIENTWRKYLPKHMK
jgi:hypothetical protein